ncbi:MAG: chemotaxis protein CheX [Polyangiales bacterium]
MEWQKPLKELCLRVFETMCFAVPLDDEDASQPPDVGYSVAFKSADPNAVPAAEGCLWVGLQDECAMEMVSSMLGDPCPAPEDLRDGVAELANVIVGQLFLTHAPNSGHHLGTPIYSPKPPAGQSIAEVTFTFDTGSAAVILASS